MCTGTKVEAGSDNMLVFIWLELPLQDGGGEEMRIIGFLKTSVISRKKNLIKMWYFSIECKQVSISEIFRQY